jgi:exonuclease III
MAFRNKFQAVLKFKPDILVIQECEHKDKIIAKEGFPEFTDFIWVGDNKNKGVGVISFNNYNIKLSKKYDPKFKYIIPIHVTGDITSQLFAIWAMPSKLSKRDSYVGQIWNALQHYKIKKQNNTILIGDWNSNAIWDNERKGRNHSAIVDLLSELNIFSLYHTLRKEHPGKEIEPTLYLLKNIQKPYHMDYCFLSNNLVDQHTSIDVGKHQNWLHLSDHMPILIKYIKGSGH